MVTVNALWDFLTDLVNNSDFPVTNAGVPVDGITGAGICGPSTICMDTVGKNIYINTNTKASPTWTLIPRVTGSTFTNPVLTSPLISTAKGVLMAVDVKFTQTAGDGVYTGTVNIPAGSVVNDVVLSAQALWNAGTSAVMKVGDASDDDGYYVGVDLNATDLLAGENISFALAGGKAGAYIAASQANKRRNTSARTITGIVTQVGSGNAGVTVMTVYYSTSVAADIINATKA